MPAPAARRLQHARLVAATVHKARIALLLIGLLPWLLTLARASLPLGRVGVWLDASFVVVCHRLPERALALGDTLMPVCSRCAGLFLGLALAGALARPKLQPTTSRWLLFGAGVLMLLDVLRQDLGGGLLHPLRIATGVAVGYAGGLALIAAIRGRTRNAARSETKTP